MNVPDVHTHRPVPPGATAIRSLEPGEVLAPAHGYFSAGIHPWHIGADREARMERVARLSSSPQVVALGECGLDKACLKALPAAVERDAAFRLQMQVFEAHIRLSEAVGKPLIIHCVRAWGELLALHRQCKPGQAWVVHGFRGNRRVAEMLLAEGLYLSFGERYQADALRAVPDGRLFAETDESALPIGLIAENLARDRGDDPNELARILTANFRRVFFRES